MSTKVEAQASSKLDVVKLVVAAALVLAGLGGFYYFAEHSLLLRVLGLLGVVVAAAAVGLTTEKGAELWQFIQGSRAELRRVDWPTRTETVQTTLAVMAMVILVGVALWLIDMLLFWLVRLLIGQGG
jgi:preprotein translocase subunit SecE